MDKEATLNISVSPKSSKSEIRIDRDIIKVYLNSPPVDGRANAECINLFAKRLKIPRSRIKIVKGEKGKRKRINIQGLSGKDIFNLLRG